MGKIQNSLGRVLPFLGRSRKKDLVLRGAVNRRLQRPYDNRVVGVVGDLDSHNDVVASILTSLTGDLIGTGIRPSFDTGVAALDQRLARLWEAWAEEAEVTGLAFDDAMNIAIRGWIINGEAFVILTESGRIQILGSDDLPTSPINDGIECDSTGRPIAYHFRPGMETIRVPAELVLHLAHRTTPRQLRGVSPLLPVLGKIQDLAEYDAAEQAAAKMAAKVSIIVKTTDSEGFDRDSEGGLEDLPDGMAYDRLQPGESVEMLKAHRPNAELSNYRAAILRAIFAALGVDIVAASRSAQSSYSASRSLATASSRDQDQKYQQIKRQLLSKILRWLVDGWRRAGLVALTEETRWAALHPDWRRSGRPDHIDPSRMASAMATMLDAGLATKDELRQHFSGFGQSGTQATRNRQEGEPGG